MPAQVRGDKQQNKSRLPKSLFTVLIIIFAGMLFTRVVLFNILATSGQRLAAVNSKIEILKEENQNFENIISNQISLEKVELFAEKSGFVKVENVNILTTSRPIANR